MKYGQLSDYFDSVAFKTLSTVEADTNVSHQHEFNGVGGFVRILGIPTGKQRYEATFMYLTDDTESGIEEPGFLTWYDAREKARTERGIDRTEYRLYFSANAPLQSAREGDYLFVAKPKGRERLLVLVVEQETTISAQLKWLFGFGDRSKRFKIHSEEEFRKSRLGLAASFILDEMGIESRITDEDSLEEMIKLFHGEFPASTVFSEYARKKAGRIDAREDPDLALDSWLEKEEALFRTLENHLLGGKFRSLVSRMKDPEGVNDILSVSMAAFQRRKARAGRAFENHLEYLFRENGLGFSRGQVTENHNKPDFIFPDIESYRDPDFPRICLTMLGVKTTCKDRWRQILTEADRISPKHLITLQPSISVNQTEEMRHHKVELVVPKSIHDTFTQAQRRHLLTVDDFISLVKDRQRLSGKYVR